MLTSLARRKLAVALGSAGPSLIAGWSGGLESKATGVGAIRGRVVLQQEVLGVSVMVQDRGQRVAPDPEGRFTMEEVPAGRVQLVTIDNRGNGFVGTVTVLPGVVTDVGDLALGPMEKYPGVDLLHGIGLEELVTVAEPAWTLATVVYTSDASAAFGIRVPELNPMAPDQQQPRVVKINLRTGEQSALHTLDALAGAETRTLRLIDDRFLVVEDRQGIEIADVTEGAAPKFWTVPFEGTQRIGTWVRAKDLWYLSVGPGLGSYGIFSVVHVDLAHWPPAPASAALSDRRPLFLLVAAGPDRSGNFIHLPFHFCNANPTCTAQEAAEEAAGSATVVRLDPATGSEQRVATVEQIRPVLSPGQTGIAAAFSDSALYLLHERILTRVDLATGFADELFPVTDFPPGTWLAAEPGDSSVLLADPGDAVTTARKLKLVAIPSLSERVLVLSEGSDSLCCFYPASAVFLPGSALRITGKHVLAQPFPSEGKVDADLVFTDFYPDGTMRFRGTSSGHALGPDNPPPALIVSPDGKQELTIARIPPFRHD